MALIQRYTDTLRGEMTLTGNTLGFSQAPIATTGIDAFLSTNGALSVPGYPAPSTLNWQSNGSTAVLSIPAGSTIEYAELIWGGSATNNTQTLPIATLNTPINFITPSGSNTINFNAATASQNTVGGQTFYTRSQDVTALVRANGAGTYEVDGVPAILNPSPGQTASAGWTLAVIYSNESLPYKNVNLYVGNSAIAASNPPVYINISGFATPATGTVDTRVLASAIEGNPSIIGDSLSIGPTVGTLTALSGPNNPANNFFDSTINNDAGTVDTLGSFGTLNQTPGSLSPGVRSAWDITNVDGSAAFTNSQNAAVARLATTGDTYALSTLGITLRVNSAEVSTTKSVDKNYAKPGDVLTYTFYIVNSGDANADNVTFTDLVPNGVTFIPGSLTASQPFTGTNPNTGITFTGPIVAGGNATVTFQVQVGSTIPNPNLLTNDANVNYEFTSAPGLSPITDTSTSNQVTTEINKADLVSPGNFNKANNKTIADIGEEITYTITVTNTGNVDANNVFITDSIPNGTSYVAGSITSNVAFTGNPTTQINLTNPIAPNETVSVTFRVLVNSIPNPNPIPNTAKVDYTYTVDPGSPNGASGSGNTNTVTTQINNGSLSTPLKTSSLAFANVGDEIIHTITFTNNGNVNTNNVVVTDSVPNGTSLIAGSLSANVPYTGGSLATGITLTNPVAPGETIVISYRLLVTAIPNPNPIPNTATVNYSYLVNPNNPPVIKSTNSNTVTTQVNNANIMPQKTTNLQYADVGDEIFNTITFINTGNVNAENVVITDPLPNGTTFVAGSLSTNVPYTGGSLASGITLTNPVAPGQTIVISYRLLVTSIPNPNPIPNKATVTYKYTVDPSKPQVTTTIDTNTTTTEVKNAKIDPPVKTGTPSGIVQVGDKINYSVTFTNTGNVNAENVVITDPIRTGTSLVLGSLTVNVPFTGNLDSGIFLTNPVAPGETIVVNYTLLVEEIPNPNPIINIAKVTYKYRVDPNNPLINGETDSNEVSILVNPISIVKTCTPSQATLLDTITYNFLITNTSGVSISNVKFFDTLPEGVTFISDSFVGSTSSNVIAEDLVTGVPLGTIAAGANLNVSFKVQVNDVPCPLNFPNNASITYSAQFQTGVTSNVTSTSNICTVDYKTVSFLQGFKDGILTIPSQKPDMESIVSVDVNISFQGYEIINSPIGTSSSKQNLTGKKLSIDFKLCIVVTYIATDSVQSVHSAEYEIGKCEYIVLPNLSDYNCLMTLSNKIEDVFYSQLNNRSFFYNITYILESGI